MPGRSGTWRPRPSAYPTTGSTMVRTVDAEPAADTVVVARVIDGDTIVMVGPDGAEGDHVRLLGIDTPERGEAGFAEAGDFVRALIEGAGGRVRLERDPEHDDRDRFGRLLRHVYLPDGRNVQVLVIEAGHSRYETRWGRSKVLEALLAE